MTSATDSAPDPAARATATAGAAEVLNIENLHVTVHHGAAAAVRGVSLSVQAGEVVGLVGESGSGKTLTCRAALGVLPPGCEIDQGTIAFDGADITSASRRDWERIHGSGIGAVFQDPASYLNPSLTVGGQVAEVLRVKLGLSRRQARRRTAELLAAVGLHQPGRVYHQIPAELSGGMLQRVMLAIAISCDPRLLIADEATTALDVTIQAEIIELIRNLSDTRRLAVLFVSHDLAVIRELCDRVVVFYAGEVVESGTVEEIISRPAHPYTRALLQVASVGDFRRRELRVIGGQPPRVGETPAGCAFAPRCVAAIDRCGAGPVPLTVDDARRQVRCLRSGDENLAAEIAAKTARAAAGRTAQPGEELATR
ncbi:MAG: ABC transporter ATP-binding protein [Nocardiopsaceae bacterium]|nr:ABC transporter ATP-binding protein [Nocardiopsaceae bacterium]